MNRYESRVTRYRWFKWEWAVDHIRNGQIVCTQYGTTPFKGIAYQTAHVLRNQLTLNEIEKAWLNHEEVKP